MKEREGRRERRGMKGKVGRGRGRGGREGHVALHHLLLSNLTTVQVQPPCSSPLLRKRALPAPAPLIRPLACCSNTRLTESKIVIKELIRC